MNQRLALSNQFDELFLVTDGNKQAGENAGNPDEDETTEEDFSYEALLEKHRKLQLERKLRDAKHQAGENAENGCTSKETPQTSARDAKQ